MASNYTTNYNLCQWQPTDQVQRTDFNADNAKIDAALAAKAEQSGLDALESAVELKAAQSALNAAIATIPKVAAGTYSGDGAASRIINLGFTPKAVYVAPHFGGTFMWLDNKYSYYGGLAVQGGTIIGYPGTSTVLAMEIVSNGFRVYYNEGRTEITATNAQGTSYRYVAIG